MGPIASERDPRITVDAMLQAVNDHQLETLAASFDDDYVNETPSHPQRSFRGNAQVKKNWAQIFASVPDVTARAVGSAVDGERVWVELEMSGSKVDGGSFLMRGVDAAVGRVTRSSDRDT
jgi:hypothetical protein